MNLTASICQLFTVPCWGHDEYAALLLDATFGPTQPSDEKCTVALIEPATLPDTFILKASMGIDCPTVPVIWPLSVDGNCQPLPLASALSWISGTEAPYFDFRKVARAVTKSRSRCTSELYVEPNTRFDCIGEVVPSTDHVAKLAFAEAKIVALVESM